MASTLEWSEIFEDLRAHIEDLAKEAGMDEETAEALAWKVRERLRSAWGGNLLYVPNGVQRDRSAQLWKDVYEKFRGSNHVALAQEFGISITYVYRIVRETRARERKRRQPTLPGLNFSK